MSGRAAFALWPWIEVGASLHTQRYASDADLDLEFVGFDLSARWQGLVFRGEFVEARVDRESPFQKLEQNGWYAEVAYVFDWDRRFLPLLAIVTRRDHLDLDKSRNGADDQRTWSLGLNLRLYRGLRFKLEHQWTEEDGANLDNDAFLSQVVFEF